jgi:hypothetical protein
VAAIASQLQEGDFVNVISTRNGEYWASHVGLVVLGPDGEAPLPAFVRTAGARRDLRRLHRPRRPRARNATAEGKNGQVLAGFKFLRLNDNAGGAADGAAAASGPTA